MLLHTHERKGQSNFSLERFIAQHCNAYMVMRQGAEHVAFQLLNEHNCVRYSLDVIQTSDAGLQPDDGPTGKCNNFESCAAHPIKYDPVTKKCKLNKKAAQISSVAEANLTTASGTPKSGISKTGVRLCYHTLMNMAH